MASTTTRYVGDTDAIKLSVIDAGTVRTDLATAKSLAFLAVNQKTPTDTITGPATVINPPETDGSDEWNCQYQLVTGDTAAAGTFDMFITVTEADGTTVATYGVTTLVIKDKT